MSEETIAWSRLLLHQTGLAISRLLDCLIAREVCEALFASEAN